MSSQKDIKRKVVVRPTTRYSTFCIPKSRVYSSEA